MWNFTKTSKYLKLKNVFHLPHICIIGMHHCGNTHREALKRHSDFQDVLCRRDYAEHVLAIFVHQIQSEYCGVNMSVSIESIAIEKFSPTYQ